MAIIKVIKTRYGVDATYWRVMKFFDIDVKSARLGFMLYGWVDQMAHDNGEDELEKITIEAQGQEFSTMAFSITLDQENVYNALKRVCETKALELEQFSGGSII